MKKKHSLNKGDLQLSNLRSIQFYFDILFWYFYLMANCFVILKYLENERYITHNRASILLDTLLQSSRVPFILI